MYVRDCKSLEGTYVGKKCIGSKEDDAPRGFYIGKDVVITVKPYWRFRVSLLYHTELKNPLNSIQLKESNVSYAKVLVFRHVSHKSQLFRHRYLITDRTLGRGTFANVHLALEVRTGKQLACKVHDLDRVRQLAPSRDLIRRIIDETDLLGKLKHVCASLFYKLSTRSLGTYQCASRTFLPSNMHSAQHTPSTPLSSLQQAVTFFPCV